MARRIVVDHSRCTGCRGCEAACSLRHFNAVDPARSRVRVVREEARFWPVIAGRPVEEECRAKVTLRIGEQEFDACALCRAICPSRPWFRDGEGKPLGCTLCGECVRWCPSGALQMVEV